jgi:hypothetical protein
MSGPLAREIANAEGEDMVDLVLEAWVGAGRGAAIRACAVTMRACRYTYDVVLVHWHAIE